MASYVIIYMGFRLQRVQWCYTISSWLTTHTYLNIYLILWLYNKIQHNQGLAIYKMFECCFQSKFMKLQVLEEIYLDALLIWPMSLTEHRNTHPIYDHMQQE